MMKFLRSQKFLINLFKNYLIFKFLSGLLYTLGLILFFNNSTITNNLGNLVIQEFFFSYFLTSYRINYVGKNLHTGNLNLIKLSLVVLFFCVIYNYKDFIDYIFLYLSITIFPFYLIINSRLEKSNFEKSVRIENYSSILSSISFFTVAMILYSIEIQYQGLIFIRFLGIFISYILLSRTVQTFDYKNFLSLTGNSNFFNFGLFLLFTLFLHKFILMKYGLMQFNEESHQSKIFLVIYDVIAAIYGLFLRYVVSVRKDNSIHTRKKKLTFSFIISVICISFFSFLFQLLGFEIEKITISTILLSFIIASSYGIIILEESARIKTFYIGIFIFSIAWIYQGNMLYGFASVILGIPILLGFSLRHKNIG